MKFGRGLAECALQVVWLLVSLGPNLSLAKSNKFDTGIVNLLKINLEVLLVKILRYSQAQETRELERMKQLLFHYYKYNKTANLSEIYRWTPMEDFDIFTGTPPELSINHILSHIHHNQAVQYKASWKSQRRRNHSKACRDNLKRCLRKLPHVNASLARLILDEIDDVTIPANPYHHKIPTTTRKLKRWTRKKNYLRYVSYRSLPTLRPKNKTTVHMCEHC